MLLELDSSQFWLLGAWGVNAGFWDKLVALLTVAVFDVTLGSLEPCRTMSLNFLCLAVPGEFCNSITVSLRTAISDCS